MSAQSDWTNSAIRIIPRPKTTHAWWADAPREGFTERAEAERRDHMRGSSGEKALGRVMILGQENTGRLGA